MNKKELVNEIQANLRLFPSMQELSKEAINEVISALIDSVQNAIANGEKVKISGLGTFEKRETKERKGRNPSTGEELIIPSCSKPYFKASKLLKEALK